MAIPDQTEPDHGRVPRSRAPRLYEALGWAALAATLLAISIVIISRINLQIGLAVLIVFAGMLVMGTRAVFAHHQSEDARRAKANADYEESLQNLIGSVRQQPPSSEPLAPPHVDPLTPPHTEG
jgi:hypothetical protein